MPFDRGRIERAVQRAAVEAGHGDPALPVRVTDAVLGLLARHQRRIPRVEDIQNAVEETLMTLGCADVARAYVTYRRQRAQLREAKRLLGVRDELKLSLAATAVLTERYLRRDESGRLAESTGEMMDRVAGFVAAAEETYRVGSAGQWSERFSRLLRDRAFLPNSPTLMNAGTPLGLLSGCVVLPLDDSLRSIFATLGQAALVHQAGGGTGYSFSRLRPSGDRIASTSGGASGPVSFLGLFDAAAEVIKQGGRRRAASMAVLDASHPDILEFVGAKDALGRLENFNLSVAVTDGFIRAVQRGGSHALVNPRTGRAARRVSAVELFDRICAAAWATGDPGLLFVDRINAANPVPSLGRIEATNPCGEVPLLPYESCNLGSINLARLARNGHVDWDEMAGVTAVAVRFLDDVIDVSRYPSPELERAALTTRKVGLGVMGLAELLVQLGLPYDSERAARLAARIAAFISAAARKASADLAAERGAFPAFEQSVYAEQRTPLRNAQLTSIAPTGTISLVAGTTSGIEPLFAIAYVRMVLGQQFIELNPLFERMARRGGFYSDQLIADIAAAGGVRRNLAVPEAVRSAFVTALEIDPGWHLRMQAAVQRHVDAAVSKTVNLPADATQEDVRDIFLRAWRSRVKGITVYRYGSRHGQVLSFLSDNVVPPIAVDAEYAGGCIGRGCEF